jgi:hypothetical protein
VAPIDEDDVMALASDMDVFQGEEGRELTAFLAARRDAEAVARYLAFLDATDPARAALLRQAQRVGVATSVAEAARENAVVTELAQRLRGPQHTWWDVVNDAGNVRNCGAARDREPAVRFVFRCPLSWANLAPTPASEVRDCSICGEQVFHCETTGEVARRARLGQCISVPSEIATRAMKDATSSILGRPDPLQCWADAVFDP